MRTITPAWRRSLAWRRRLSALVACAGVAALAAAWAGEHFGGLVPCALCLLERWPYRVLIALGVLGAALPISFGRAALVLALVTALGGAGLAGIHVGVEHHLWPSPLPECAAPRLQGDTVAEQIAAMPARPATPCDQPVFPVPGIPVSMALLNGLGGLAIALVIAICLPRTARPRPAAAVPPPEIVDAS